MNSRCILCAAIREARYLKSAFVVRRAGSVRRLAVVPRGVGVGILRTPASGHSLRPAAPPAYYDHSNRSLYLPFSS
ncbi:unnamed protein product, partial [Brenthis ino]